MTTQRTKDPIHINLGQGLPILILAAVLFLGAIPTSSSAQQPPERRKEITVTYYEHEWWLTRWEDNRVSCTIYIDHEGIPTPLEIFYQCGSELYQEWIESAPCQESTHPDQETCPGYYLHHAQKARREKTISVELPAPEVYLEISDCPLNESNRICSEPPYLVLTATEPLPNEVITQIHGRLGGIPFQCQGKRCEIPLHPTSEDGIPLSFWANSSFGDSSQHYEGKIRVVERLLPEDKSQRGYQIDLISDQYEEGSNLSCSNIWHAFPPLGAGPDWLANPQNVEHLATDLPLAYLAGRLITHQLADASACSDGGLLENGYASPCGIQEARWAVTEWQNNFDPYIMQTSQKMGIPSQLLKRVFIQESQLWPESLDGEYQEHGLGHLTELGAETTLLWNRSFFEEFCPLVLSKDACQWGYPNLRDYQKALLRGALITRTSAKTADIVYNQDFSQYRESIDLFATSLVGHCQQTQQMITNTTGKKGGEVSSYQDLWKFTLANYHSGAGCVGEAIEQISNEGLPMSWYNVSSALKVNCPMAVEYIETITR